MEFLLPIRSGSQADKKESQEDSDSAINFVQTSAQYVPNRMAIDATGHVTSPETVQRSLGHSGVISVSADGRVHTEI